MEGINDICWSTHWLGNWKVCCSNPAQEEIFRMNFSSVCFFPRTLKWRFKYEDMIQLVDEEGEDARAALVHCSISTLGDQS